ncbi:MAG: UMP kinase [Myxococcota bacterium]
MKNSSNKKTVLLKLSGEALVGSQNFGIDKKALTLVSKQVKSACETNNRIGIVIGGGNIFRGISLQDKMPRHTGDTMGMLATLLNSLALSASLEATGIATQVLSAFPTGNRIPEFSEQKALNLLNQDKVVIFGGGTGNPYFTTDTAAVLRALQINASLLIKATKVDGIYDSDPEKNKDAVFFPEITYEEVLQNNLKVMDGAAIATARDNNLSVQVLNLFEENSIKKALNGKKTGTLVKP